MEAINSKSGERLANPVLGSLKTLRDCSRTPAEELGAASTVAGGWEKMGLPRGLVLVETGSFTPGPEPSVTFLRAN